MGKLLVIVTLAVILAAIGSGYVSAATNPWVTVPVIPCWARIVQLDPNYPLPQMNCDTQTAHYPAYVEEFWQYVTKDVTFMYGNNTVSVYGIAVGWDETRTECTTTTKRYQQDYKFGE